MDQNTGSGRVIIRIADQNDIGLLSHLGREAFQQAFGAANTEENMSAYLAGAFSEDKQAEELTIKESLFLIAEVDGQAVGYARLLGGSTDTCITGKQPVELVRIYALREWIGKGVGAALMEASLSEARRRGYDVIWLGVWQENPRAISFYEKWGFRIAGTHAFTLGDDLQTDWIMQRAL